MVYNGPAPGTPERLEYERELIKFSPRRLWRLLKRFYMLYFGGYYL